MVIESKPLLSTILASLTHYINELEKYRDQLLDAGETDDAIYSQINCEIDISNAIINAANNELKNNF